MGSQPTTGALKRCECGAELPEIEAQLWGVVFKPRYCDGCVVRLTQEQEQLERQERVARLLSMAGGTARLERFTWERATAAHVGRSWIESEYSKNLVLSGPVGCGKTGLAWLIVKTLCEVGVEARLVNFRLLLQQLREAMDDPSSSHATAATKARFVPVLALDDLGAERPTDWAREQLTTLIDARYEHGRPTIVTTNYAVGDLARRLGHDDPVVGQRIVSRLTEDALVYRMAGGDRRLHAEAKL